MKLSHPIPYCFLYFLLSLHVYSYGQNEKNELNCHSVYEASALKEDFNILLTTLKEVHPDIYRVSSEEKLGNRISNIEASISSKLSYLQFLKLIAEMMTDIGCINTQWGHSRAYIEYRNKNIPLFPIKVRVEQDYFIVEENWSDNKTIKKGDTILSFNGISIKEYLEKNYPLLPTDGQIRTIQRKWLGMAFPKHHSNFWEQVEDFNLQISSKEDGKRKSENVAAMPSSEIKERQKKYSNNEGKIPELSFRESIAIIKANSFSVNSSVLDSIFTEIKKNEVKALILDIRHRSFSPGSNQFGSELFSYLVNQAEPYASIKNAPPNIEALTFSEFITDIQSLERKDSLLFTSKLKPKANHFDGKLFVLTNGWNIGASGFFSVRIKSRPNTFFIGEKAGTTTFGMNFNVLMLKLPNTHIQFYIPKHQMIANKTTYLNTLGSFLDFEIIDDDECMENALIYVKSHID